LTPEPRANAHRRARELIFVVQKHRRVLKSWAVPKGPPRRSPDKRLAVRVEGHPYANKDFEGKIPEGEYGAGTVEKWDGGTYAPEGATISQRASDPCGQGCGEGA